MRLCTNCGERAGGGNFCGNCGARLDAPAPPAERSAPGETAGPVPSPDQTDPATSPLDQSAAPPATPPAMPEPVPAGTHEAGDATAGRSRRGIAAAVGAVVGAALIATAGYVVFSGSEVSEASGGYPQAAPDLAEQPEIAWTLDVAAGAAVKADNGLLIVSADWGGDSPAVHGVEPDTGEVRWTQETFDVGFEPYGIWCYVAFGDMVACSAYGEGVAVLALDPADGSQRWATEYPDDEWEYMREVGDELLVATYDSDNGDIEVSRVASDGTKQWTSTDNVFPDVAADDVSTPRISDLGMNEQHVLVELTNGFDQTSCSTDPCSVVLGFDRATGQPVPWVTSESADGFSFKLAADGVLRLDRTGEATLIERLNDEGAVVWAYEYSALADPCNEVDYAHLYLCSDDGPFTALDWETGEEAWTLSDSDEVRYAGETEDSVVLTEDGALGVVDVASGQLQRGQQAPGLRGDGGWYTGNDLLPISEGHVYAVVGLAGTGPNPTPAPGAVDSAVVAYALDGGTESWRLPVPDLGDRLSVSLLVVDGQLLLINGEEWIAALE